MDVPGIVRERLADERRMTSVNVGGDDRVYITPPKTLVYRAAGLFSSESIEEFPHDVGRFDVSADRREATFAFEYEHGVEAFSAPRERIETILPPVLAGVLRTTGLIDDGERIEESYRFGERTLIVTDRQLLTSVGEAVWDREHDSYDFERVTDLRFDEDLRIDVDGRPRYIELDGDGRREAYETLESALCAYHGVASIDQLSDRTAERTTDAAPAESEARPVATDPIGDGSTRETVDRDAGGTADPSTEQPAQPRSPSDDSPDPLIPEATESDHAGDEPTAHDESEDIDERQLADEVDALSERVERQTQLLERQTELLEQLVEEASTRRVNDDR
ncbi:DUF7115 domain-containing protein [Halococcus sp. AFM35]|uniref:DUF7115 domain-containing protein n=1 Tax=Halococcus sp. AFM35 TaxID=3421653 RepID=UPI003EBA09BD